MFTNPFRTITRSRDRRKRILQRGIAATAGGLLLASAFVSPAAASPVPITVDLGSAASFSLIAGAAATIPGSTLPGEVGAIAAITDDKGTVYGAAQHTPNDTATQNALTDASGAFGKLFGLASTTGLEGSDLGGQKLTPGVYHSDAALSATSSVTFDAGGDSNAYFIIQGDAALGTTAGITMNLVGGAQASHIFWVIKGAATVGASSDFDGTVMSEAAITVGASVHFYGRALSLTAAVTLDADVFGPVDGAVIGAAPSVTISGGSDAVTGDSTPTISGTTDAPAGTAVTVTVGKTTLETTVLEDGTWTVTVGTALPDGTVTVTASVTPPEALPGSATQNLTVDTTGPSLTITGGSALKTRDSTPTISGTTDAPQGSVVRVTVADQSFKAIVESDGSWSTTAAVLPKGAVTVVATVADAAGNTAKATQKLTVLAPIVHHLSDRVYFAGDSSTITSATRTEIAALIHRVPTKAIKVTVHITGYIKLIGRTTENKKLATARAQAVYLLMKGKVAAAYTLTGVGKGLSHDVSARHVDVAIAYTLPDGS